MPAMGDSFFLSHSPSLSCSFSLSRYNMNTARNTSFVLQVQNWTLGNLHPALSFYSFSIKLLGILIEYFPSPSLVLSFPYELEEIWHYLLHTTYPSLHITITSYEDISKWNAHRLKDWLNTSYIIMFRRIHMPKDGRHVMFNNCTSLKHNSYINDQTSMRVRDIKIG